MKPRVMFVDDDPMLQASTRRQLLLKLPEYELVFCNSGREALEMAAIAVPEIIFSDVRMPEMDGPDLLRRMEQEHPGTVRFALTGQSEASQLDQVYTVAHQVFTKPCETERLCEVIETTTQLRAQLTQNCPLSKLTRFFTNTPSNLRQIAELIKVLEDSRTTTDDLAIRIEQDSAIGDRILQIVNTSIAGQRSVTDTASAIELTGFPLAAAIYLAVLVNERIEMNSHAAFEMDSCMEEGIAVARHAQQPIVDTGIDPARAVQVMIACLFHAFGHVLLAMHGGTDYSKLKQQASKSRKSLAEIEQATFGVRHEIAGGYVLQLWGLNAEVCLAIANQDSTKPVHSQSIQEFLQEAITARKLTQS